MPPAAAPPAAPAHPPTAPASGPLDESPAAINGVLAAWVGLLASLVVAAGGFDDPRPLHNGLVRLLTLGATAGVLGWSLQLGRVGLARRLQLGVAVSLLLHTLLGAVLMHTRLAGRLPDPAELAQQAPRASKTVAKPPVLAPVVRRLVDDRPEFDRPLQTGAPQRRTADEQLSRNQAAIDTQSAQAPVAPAPSPRVALLSPRLPRPDAMTARQSPDPSQRSRTRDAARLIDGEILPLEVSADPPRPPSLTRAAEATQRRSESFVPSIETPTVRPPETTASLPSPTRPGIEAPQLAVATSARPRLETPRLSPDALPTPKPRKPARAGPPRPRRAASLAPLARTDQPPAATPGFAVAPTPVRPTSPGFRLAAPDRQQPAIESPTRRNRLAIRPRPLPLAPLTTGADWPDQLSPAGPDADRLAAPGRGPGPTPRAADAPAGPVGRADASPTTMSRNAAAALESLLASPPVATKGTPGGGLGAGGGGGPGLPARDPQPGPPASGEGSGPVRSRPAIGSLAGGPGGSSAALPLPEDTPSPPAEQPAAGGIRAGATAAAAPQRMTQAITPSADASPPGDGNSAPTLSALPLSTQPSNAGPPPRLASRGTPTLASPLRSARTRRAAVAAPLGPGGLTSLRGSSLALPADVLPRPGEPADQAGRSSRTRGAVTAGGGQPRRASPAFDSRGQRRDQQLSGGPGRPTSPSEAAIELGLRFLTRLQQPDGRWSFADYRGLPVDREEVPNIQADAAATGLALLAFLGAGYDHFGGPYQTQVARGLDFLVRTQSPSGMLFPEDRNGASPWQVARFYSHGIASIALCEAYGMTGDVRLRLPAQRAIDYIADEQNRNLGGWRYTPGVSSDLSVTGWQMMALKSGDLAGLDVPRQAYVGVRRFVERCREAGGERARFCYNPTASADNPRTRHGRGPGTVMTSVGLLMRLYLGEDRGSRQAAAAADHLLANLPRVGEQPKPAATSTLGNPRRDTYYWYYATQVMFQMQGDYWPAWKAGLMPMLIDTQTSRGPLAGSWDPRKPVPDKWSAYGGRLYVTSMNLLSLEVSYRHLPLYTTGGPAERASAGR